MGCGNWREVVLQQKSFSVRILGGKLQHIKKAITLNRVCIHQAICMHREHAGAWRAASHAGFSNNYSGEVSRALLINAQTSAEQKHPPAQLSHTPSATKDLPHQRGKSRAASGDLFSLRMKWIKLTDSPGGVACSVPGKSGSSAAAADHEMRIMHLCR